MTWLEAPQNWLYQNAMSACITGRFSCGGALRKCSSILFAPVSSFLNSFIPMDNAMGKPMADQSEYRPPTQSHIGNRFS